MNNQHEHLIALLEQEKRAVQENIDANLLEMDYLMAHYCLQSLLQLNHKLRVLKSIDDRLYDAKSFKQVVIDRFEKYLETENSSDSQGFYANALHRMKQELAALNEIPIREASQQRFTLLDESLEKLIAKKIKNLKLILHKKDNLLLQFDCSKKKVKVTMPRFKQLVKKQILQEDKLTSLQNIGFVLNEKGTELILILSGDSEANLVQLKIILSKITFDIFFFRDFQNQSFIQFTEK